ncbi:MAG: DUF4258 domain-containing protein [Candidatus Methanospirareceae archaeon]|nr:MAG: DUF4258 domain-containing protein [Methanosarcinales archaeon Met12]
MEFIFTRHAKEKMDCLGYAPSEVKETIVKGMKIGPDSRGNMHARMGTLEVVFRKLDQKVVVITVFEVKR